MFLLYIFYIVNNNIDVTLPRGFTSADYDCIRNYLNITSEAVINFKLFSAKV